MPRWPRLGQVRLTKLGAHKTDRRYHSVLAAALRQARRWGLVTQVVTDLASPPPVHGRPPTVPDPSAVQGLVNAAEGEDPVLAMATVLAAITRARLGELCGLRWPGIDLDNNVLHIRRAVKHGLYKRELVVGPTKTHQDRKVSLGPTALALLAGHRQRVEGRASHAGVSVPEDGYVLPGGPAWGFDPTGAEPVKPNTVTSAFARLSQRCGAKVRFHDLRHLFATKHRRQRGRLHGRPPPRPCRPRHDSPRVRTRVSREGPRGGSDPGPDDYGPAKNGETTGRLPL